MRLERYLVGELEEQLFGACWRFAPAMLEDGLGLEDKEQRKVGWSILPGSATPRVRFPRTVPAMTWTIKTTG